MIRKGLFLLGVHGTKVSSALVCAAALSAVLGHTGVAATLSLIAIVPLVLKLLLRAINIQ